MKTNVKPCAKCGGKLRPVQSEDGMVNALYCDSCRILHMLNGKYWSIYATIEHYNCVYDKLAEGGNDAD